MTTTVYELIGFALVQLDIERREVDKLSSEAAENIRQGADTRSVQCARAWLYGKRSVVGRTVDVMHRLAAALNDDPIEPDGRTSLTRLDDLRDELLAEVQRWKGQPGWRKEWEL